MTDNNIRAKIGAGFVGGALVLGTVGYELGDKLGIFLGIAAAATGAGLIRGYYKNKEDLNLLAKLEEGIKEGGLEGLFDPGHHEMMKNLKSILKREDYLGLVTADREVSDPILKRYTLETRYGKVNLCPSIIGLTVESVTNFKDCPYYNPNHKVAQDIAHKIGIYFSPSNTVKDAQVFQSQRILVQLFDKFLLYDNWEYQLASRALEVTAAESAFRNYLEGGTLPSSEEIEKLKDLPKELKLYH